MALAVYVVAAVWMLYGLDYALGDALARSSNARNVLDSRDPHLAAMGFVWLPLPVLGQLPLMAILSPLDVAELSSSLFTAICGALTVFVLARMAVWLELPRRLAITFVTLFALNPVVVYYAGNGMSEAPSFLFLVIALFGFLRWNRTTTAADLVLLAVGLGGGMLVRYESVGVTVVLAVAAALRISRRDRPGAWLSTVVVAALPAAALFVLWLFTSWLLMKDPLHWADVMSITGRPPADAHWLPSDRTLASGVAHAGELTIRLAPGLLGLVASALTVRGRAARVTTLGIVGVAAVFPGSVALSMARDQSWGNPRYFAPLCVISIVLAMWLAHEWRDSGARLARRGALVALVAVSVFASTWTLTDPSIAAIESEPVVFRSLLGDPHSAPSTQPDLGLWRDIAARIDPLLDDGAVIATDANVAFPAVLLSDHPRSWIVASDRDFEQVVSAPPGRIDLVLRTESRLRSGATFDRLLDDRTGGRWHERGSEVVLGNGIRAQLFEWVPDDSPTHAPNAPIQPGGT